MLDNIKIFDSLSKEEKDILSLFIQKRILDPGEHLFYEWDEGNAMYIVESWLLEAYVEDKVLWQIWPQEFVWEMALFFENKKRIASVRALKKTEVYVILSFSLDELWKKHPEIIEKIKSVISFRMNKNKKII